jgi:hypothetical protein
MKAMSNSKCPSRLGFAGLVASAVAFSRTRSPRLGRVASRIARRLRRDQPPRFGGPAWGW